MPVFNNLTGKQLSLPADQLSFWLRLFSIVILVTGFVSGSYPALFLSSLNPIRVLKGSLKFNWSAIFFRKGLVIFQFSLSIVFIVAMIVIYRQLNYIQTKNIGYDRENLVYVSLEGELGTKYSLFKEEASKINGIRTDKMGQALPLSAITPAISSGWERSNTVASFINSAVSYDFERH